MIALIIFVVVYVAIAREKFSWHRIGAYLPGGLAAVNTLLGSRRGRHFLRQGKINIRI